MLKQTSKVLAAILYTIRPSATLGACLLAVSAFNPQTKEWQEVIWLVVCAFTGSSFCFILNDIFDKEKDLLNNKKRPIATGELPLPIALIATIVFGVIFMASAAAFGKVVLILSVLFLGLATSYSFLNRVSGFPANVMVAVFVAGTQWGVCISVACFCFSFQSHAKCYWIGWILRAIEPQEKVHWPGPPR